MKTLVICFSQTGNTRRVAERIRDGIFEHTGQCDLVNMKDVDTQLLNGYDVVGLGCPVFYFKEPFHVLHFIEGLPPLNTQPWFVFCSHGAVMGQALFSMAASLEKKGALVIGSHHTYADITVPFYPKHTLTSGHPDDTDLMAAVDFGRSIAGCAQSVAKGDTRCITRPSEGLEAWARDMAAMCTPASLAERMPALSINLETCIQCGECEDACPVGGIDMGCDPPRIQEPCIYCFHCASICPTCSIEAEWGPLVASAPEKYQRYTHSLNRAEERGEFRWLVDPETVDCSQPLYKERKREIKS